MRSRNFGKALSFALAACAWLSLAGCDSGEVDAGSGDDESSVEASGTAADGEVVAVNTPSPAGLPGTAPTPGTPPPGTIPVPGTAPVPSALPGTIPGMPPGTVPGMPPGMAVPGMPPGAIPGLEGMDEEFAALLAEAITAGMQQQAPGTVPGQIPGQPPVQVGVPNAQPSNTPMPVGGNVIASRELFIGTWDADLSQELNDPSLSPAERQMMEAMMGMAQMSMSFNADGSVLLSMAMMGDQPIPTGTWSLVSTTGPQMVIALQELGSTAEHATVVFIDANTLALVDSGGDPIHFRRHQ